MELAKKCPFLARVPSSFVRKARGPVLVSYAERCPVMSEVLNKTSEVPEKTEGNDNFSLLKLSYTETKCSKITIMILL